MKIPSYARYDYCVECACNFLEDHNINSYPVDIIKIIEKSPYNLWTYSMLMRVYNCGLDTVCKKLKSNDARTLYHDGIYTIAYNDVNRSSGRILFTLAHELGHIYLNHLLDFQITEIPKSSYSPNMKRYEYNILEKEANAFARNILVPIPLYYFLQSKDDFTLQKYFGISHDAAVVRKDLIDKDYACSKKLGLYKRFIEIYSNFKDKKACSHCLAALVQKKGAYCPICGSKNSLHWGDGNMIYPKLDTYENGKLMECPICNNEETDLEGAYCQICGKRLVNHCSNYDCINSEDALPSNARYCPICGSNSTFYNSGFLNEWNYKEEGFLPIPELDEELPFNHIPDNTLSDIDEELPFN